MLVTNGKFLNNRKRKMAKPKFDYKVVVERVVKTEYVVNAKNERDAVSQIKKATKAGQTPCSVAKVGAVVEYGKLVRPGTWSVEKVEEETAEVAE